MGTHQDLTKSAPAPAAIQLLGPVRLGDGRMGPRTRKTRALMAIVALASGPVARDTLATLLWGDRGEEQARASLRQALYELRGLPGLSSDRQFVTLDCSLIDSDWAELNAAIAAGDAPGAARLLATVQVPLLGGLDDLTDDFDQWLRDERTRLTSALVGAASAIAGKSIDSGDPHSARQIADALERIDPLDEAAARAGIAADVALGDRAAAHRRLNRLSERMKRDFGLEPSAETRAALVGVAGPAVGGTGTSSLRAPIASVGAKRRDWRLVVIAALSCLAIFGFFVVRGAPATVAPSIAVLPFDNLGQRENNYFASGVSDEILDLLSRQSRLKVFGRVSAAQLADPDTSLATARELGVDYLLDGSVRMAARRVLVIARLTRVADGEQIWSERYERSAGDIFAVQGEIAGVVAARMARSLGGARPQETTPDVYDRYLAARQLLRERREVPLTEADRLLREAIARDPAYAPALAELAQVIMLRADHPTAYGPIPLADAAAEAERLARRAIALDPNLGDGYAALGSLSLGFDARSEPYFRKAVALNPQRPEFHRWHAQSLMALDRRDDAIAEFKRAVEIDPLWGLNYDHLIGALYLVGREEEARTYVRRFLALSTDRRAKLLLMRGHANLDNRKGDELKIMRMLYRLHPEERQVRFSLASILGLLGEHREAARIFQDDPLANAIFARDWTTVASAAEKMGAEFWEQRGFWNLSNLLLSAGRGDVIVRLYDRDRSSIASGLVNESDIASPELILALRQAGRQAEADRFLNLFESEAKKLPRKGHLAFRKDYTLALAAALRGHRDAAMRTLDRLSREDPLHFATIPAMSLRYEPAFRSFVGDPRLDVADERLRLATNVERAKAKLPPIRRPAWISDSRTLLTMN